MSKNRCARSLKQIILNYNHIQRKNTFHTQLGSRLSKVFNSIFNSIFCFSKAEVKSNYNIKLLSRLKTRMSLAPVLPLTVKCQMPNEYYKTWLLGLDNFLITGQVYFAALNPLSYTATIWYIFFGVPKLLLPIVGTRCCLCCIYFSRILGGWYFDEIKVCI